MRREEDSPGMSKANLIVNVSFLLQLLAFLLSFISFFSPFWYIELNTGITIGLWGRCEANIENCIWFNERDYAWERSLPDWQVAAQVLYAIGIGILGISCCLAVGHIMFGCCKIFTEGFLPIVFGVLILIAMVFETLSIGTFGIGAYHVYECSIHSWVAHFEWAFYVGIAALFNCLFAGLAFIFAGNSIREDYKGYTAAPFSYSM
jgi:hypothetical protein